MVVLKNLGENNIRKDEKPDLRTVVLFLAEESRGVSSDVENSSSRSFVPSEVRLPEGRLVWLN